MAGIRLGIRKAKPATPKLSGVDPGEIARVAYELYQQRGCQPGHDIDDWLEAEAIVRRRCAEQNGFNGI